MTTRADVEGARARGQHGTADKLEDELRQEERAGLALVGVVSGMIAGGAIGGVMLGIIGIVVGVCLALFVGCFAVIVSGVQFA